MYTLNAILFQVSILISTMGTTVTSFDPVSCGEVSGAVLQDLNGDNIGDLPISDVEVNLYIDANGNGILDGVEGTTPVLIDPDGNGIFDTPATVLTDVNGEFLFQGVPLGQYIISEVQPINFIDQVEYDGGDDKDHPDNGQINSVPVLVASGENDSGNTFIEKRPLLDLIVFTVPGSLNAFFDLSATGALSGGLIFPKNPVSSGQSTGFDSVYVGETIDIMVSNNDNNGTLMNYTIIYEAKDELGKLLERGSTLDGSIQIVNNSKDAIFSFVVPSSDIIMKIIIVKQANIVFMKESIPSGDSTDFTFDNFTGGTGIPASFAIDAEAVDGIDVDNYINQKEFQISGGEQGVYTIQERGLDGWKLSNISCMTISGDLAESIDIPNSSITLDLQNGDKCLCTFTNIKDGAISGSVNNEGIGLSGVIVRLQDSSGTIVNSVVTGDGLSDVDGDGIIDPAGAYYFRHVVPGDYNILEEQPMGYDDLSEIDGGDDSDKIDNGLVNNIPSRVLPGEIDSGNDFVEQSTVLAVELGDFSVRTEGCVHFISINTISASNNERIELLHSYNGIEWNPIQKFEGRGTTDVQKRFNYSWMDKPVTSYFKLKFVNSDGIYTYSEIIQSAGNCATNKINIFPNPVGSTLNIHFENIPEEGISIKLMDQLGRVVMNKVLENINSDQSLSVDVSSVVAGVYFLTITDLLTDQKISHKVIK
jgi:hypothetical protein